MEDFCGFEPAKMHCEFMYITNAFQIRFDVISNSLGNKGDRILNISKYSEILRQASDQLDENRIKVFIDLYEGWNKIIITQN